VIAIVDLHQVRYFVQVARERNFTRAAEALAVAQPSLSQQIRKLERRLGFDLFERGPAGAKLTREGELLLPYATSVLDRVQEIEVAAAEIRGVQRGQITIGASPIAGMRVLPVLLRAVRERWPGLVVRTREEGLSRLLDLLEAGEVDLALVLLPNADPDLVCVPLFTEDVVVILPPDHALAARDVLALEDLREEPFVLLSQRYGVRQLVVDECEHAGFTPRIALESGDVGIVQGLVAAGLGVTVIPASAVRRDLPIVARPVLSQGERPQRRIGLAMRSDRYVPIAARRVFELAEGMIL
jgi:LysR family hydrogen peroxide-inducible transcriptional activator